MDKVHDIIVLQSATAVVHWDMETMMPPKAVQLRSQQLAMLSRITHKMVTDSEIGKLIEAIMKHPDYEKLTEVQKRNVYLIKKEYDEQTKLPEKLVAELAKYSGINFRRCSGSSA